MSNAVELISLSELIEQVKEDLLSKVQTESKETPLLFMEEIEVSAQVVAKREKGEGGKAGLSLAVFGLGAEAEVNTETSIGHELTQTVRIKLTPLYGKEEYLRDRTPQAQSEIARQGENLARESGGGGKNVF